MKLQHDNHAAVGIDLMITYVGMVIVLIVIGSTSVAMVEKIGQQVQHTALDANKEAGTKVIVVGAWIEDGYDDYLFMIEYQGQGENVLTEDVEWTLWCTEGGDLHYRSGTIDQFYSGPCATCNIWEVGDDPANSVTELVSGQRYFFGIDGGTNGAGAGGDECGPFFLDEHGITATLTINIPDGGTNRQILEVGRLQVGAPVI